MAYDKIVDSTQLDSDLTSVANAIRAKSGGSSQLAFPSGFVSAIAAIPSVGIGEYTKDIKGIERLFFGCAFSSDTLAFDFDNAVMTQGIGYAFSGTNLKNITIKNLTASNVALTGMFAKGSGNSEIQTITFENCVIAPTDFQQFARYQSSLISITGEIDMSYVTNVYDTFRNCTSLTSIRIKANSMKLCRADTMANSPFDDATLVNIGNALNGTVTGQTLTLLAAKKTRCGTLMGTNDNGTFVADENGTLSLSDFITTIKGWTLA